MNVRKTTIVLAAMLAVAGLQVSLLLVRAQVPWPGAPPPAMPVPTSPDAQRNALSTVRARVGNVQNTTRTALNYPTGGADMIWQQFQVLRAAYNTFTMTLDPQQASIGANDLAELAAGLDIIQEAFVNYQDDIAAGRPDRVALTDLCQVIRQASNVWLQELNRDCARLRVGW